LLLLYFLYAAQLFTQNLVQTYHALFEPLNPICAIEHRASYSDYLSQSMTFKSASFENIQFKKSDCSELNQFYKQHKEKSRAKPTDSLYVAIEEDIIQAGLRLLSYGDYYFLRSVFTAPAIRGQGIATKLLTHAISEHTLPIYTLPTFSALSLYQRLGFKPVDTKDIPAGLSSSYRRFRQPSQDPTVMVINI